MRQMNAFINKSTTLILWFHTLNPPVFDTLFRGAWGALTPTRLTLRNTDPPHSPPTSGSRISITWLSGAFLTQQKADPAGWDGNRVRGWDRAGGTGAGVSSPDKHTLTKPNITTWIFTQTHRGGKEVCASPLLIMTPDGCLPGLFLLTVRLPESVSTWR